VRHAQDSRERIKYLIDEKRIKAVTVLFSDLEGRLHMLDYDKKFLVKSWDNLTFDGSSIRGFTAQRESDLRLGIDWSAFYWAPRMCSARAKCWFSAKSSTRAGLPTAPTFAACSNLRRQPLQEARLHAECRQRDRRLLFKGVPMRSRDYHETGKFEYVNTGGYYHSLPGDPLRTFIDTTAEVAARHGLSRTRKITPRSRLRSLRSTTATGRWSPLPIRFSSTS
jgi:glutamine synthetase